MNKYLHSRRQFCQSVLCVAAGATMLPGCGDQPASRTEVARYLVTQIAHPRAAGAIGQHYLKGDPRLQGETAEHLTDMIMQSIGLNVNNLSTSNLPEVGKRLAKRVRHDFADETVVTVDGWLLSQTEARLCALVYLHRRASS